MMPERPVSFLLGGTHSGVGKTTMSIGLMAALRKRGFNVQPFKVGPDYIDPAYHERVTGNPSVNLDSWLLSESFIRETFQRHMISKNAAVVEGVMGLFDGLSGTSEAGSSAHIAKMLGLPVILVLDVHSMARSAAAVVGGFASFDSNLRMGGVIFNRVAGEQHFQWLKDAVEQSTNISVLGFLPNDPNLKVPERHLGLKSIFEDGLSQEFLTHLTGMIEQFVDVDQILRISKSEQPSFIKANSDCSPTEPVRLGVARDQAFCFYYQDNLDLLESLGAELVFFSPISGKTLPPDLDGLYFGGGFPELFAEKLERAEELKAGIREFFDQGKPIYAECGGLMFLVEELIDLGGVRHRMAGLIPGRVKMTEKLQACGYREAVAVHDSILARKGEVLRGHEFHWSRTEGIPLDKVAYEFRDQKLGYANRNLLASYMHLHFGSNPKWVERWLTLCRASSSRRMETLANSR